MIAGRKEDINSEHEAWTSRAKDLAAYVWKHHVVRTDRWGCHGPPGDDGRVRKWIYPGKEQAKKPLYPLTEWLIRKHFEHPKNAWNCVGLLPISTDDMCKWGAIDIDMHDESKDDPTANLNAALHYFEKLSGLGFNPLLTESNGKGGYHLRVILSEPIKCNRMFHFMRGIVAKFKDFGFIQAPETFPKQSTIEGKKTGNMLRLFGMHPKTKKYLKVYNGEAWLEGKPAIDFILTHTGDDTSLVPEVKEEKRKARKAAKQIVPADQERVRKAMEFLKPERAEGYDDWLKVGMILHRTGDGGEDWLALWDDWSTRSGNYEPGACAAKWESFTTDHNNPIGIGTLIKWGMEDAGPEFKNEFNRLVRGITNFEQEDFTDENGKEQTKDTPLTMGQILHDITDATDGWPRRVGTQLFIDDPKIHWLAKPPQLFGWLASKTDKPIRWKGIVGACSKADVFAEFQRTATMYDDIEPVPHEPRLPNVYYSCAEIAPGNGDRLRELVGFFYPATAIDADLITSLFVTSVWGGAPGTRPAFTIISDAGRGAGKSTLAALVAYLVKGSLSISANEDASQVRQRLLSPDGRTKRVAIIDNIKTMKFSWAELEALITDHVISGKEMYVGEGQRPNTLVWIITLNGANFSTDMAQRSVFIKMARAKYSATFLEDMKAYIDKHRDEIIGDCIAFLQGEQYPLEKHSRWGAWEKEVLCRLPEPGEAQRVILERQKVADVDNDEAAIIENHFAEELQSLQYDPPTSVVRIPNRIVTEWVCKALNERVSAAKVTRMMRQVASESKESGRHWSIHEDTTRTYGRSHLWVGQASSVETLTSNDLESRIQYKEDSSRGGF